MSEKIAAIIVTYNRKQLLAECLEGVLLQTRPVEKIFIIDNASSDGTEFFLKERGFFENTIIKYIKNRDNLGAAGGFHQGIKRAFEESFDLFWLMDDDVEPKPDALEIQLKFKTLSKCIHPRKVFLDGEFFLWEQLFCTNLGRPIPLNDISFKNGKEWCAVNVGCFEGMLLHRSLIPNIGYPDPRFFICDDDTTYGFLASLFTNTIYIRDAIFIKKLKPSSKKTPPRKIYFEIRNSFLKFEYLSRFGLGKKWVYFPFLIYLSFKHLTHNFYNGHFWETFKMILFGFKDGLKKNFGMGHFKFFIHLIFLFYSAISYAFQHWH